LPELLGKLENLRKDIKAEADQEIKWIRDECMLFESSHIVYILVNNFVDNDK